MLHGFPFQTSKNALSVVENDDFTKVVLRRLPTDDKISVLVLEHANQHINSFYIIFKTYSEFHYGRSM